MKFTKLFYIAIFGLSLFHNVWAIELLNKSGIINLNNYHAQGSLWFDHNTSFRISNPEYSNFNVSIMNNYNTFGPYSYTLKLDPNSKQNFVEISSGLTFCSIKFSNISATQAHYEVIENTKNGCGIGPNGIIFYNYNMIV